jgi:hypothetical protein
MTYAFVLIKGKSTARDGSLSYLESLIGNETFAKEHRVSVDKVFISFGWPDIIILLKSENVELIKNSIVDIRDKLSARGDSVDTSTIICTTSQEIKDRKKEWGLKL